MSFDRYQGISVGDMEVRLSMFADDMLLFISNPKESLEEITAVLDQFSAFAGFRVNYSKSNLMPLSKDISYFKSHPALGSFSLCTSPLKYLGIHIPRDLSLLNQVNIKPIIQSIAQSLMHWKNLPLSLSGRVAVIKSVIFPKISYVLQMLPLVPSKNDLGTIRSLFSIFLWQGKRPRLAYPRLILPRNQGGYGLPDMLTFSHSVLFRHISDWFLRRSTYSNYMLEENLFSPYSPSALLHTPRQSLPPQISSNVLFAGTYSSWCTINKCLKRKYTESKFTTFWGNPCFTPGLDNVQFRNWRDKGISAIKDIFDPGGVIRSFTYLKDTYKITNKELFMYLQARHFAQTFQSEIITKDAFSDTMSFLKSKSYKVRFFYPSLLDPLVEKSWACPADRWAKDIPTIDSPDVWLKSCGKVMKCLPSASLQETYLKTLQRAYISPWQRRHMVTEETGHCKKCGATEANFYHCLWDCSKIKRFWNKLLDYINTIFSLKLTRSPIPCLLLNFSEWVVVEKDKQLFALLVVFLTVAKQCILLHWIKRSVPLLHEFRARILSIIYYERQKAFPEIERGVEQFYKKWSPYIDKLPQVTQTHIQKVFESTSWFLARQVQ